MCGIVGFYKYKDSDVNIDTLTKLLEKRGPDSQGVYEDEKVALGHARLSVLDLETGDQPMFSTEKDIVIVFNGEIYNFNTLKILLQTQGAIFATKSDTEVLLWGYKLWGIDQLLTKVEGMFAFALWDIEKQLFFIARDRFGEKPLYYYHNQDAFYFASELKALTTVLTQKRIDTTALNLYFSLTYIPAPYTIYEGVMKLEPGHYIRFSSQGEWEDKTYYHLDKIVDRNKDRHYSSYEAAQNEMKDLLFHSVKERMVADVPVGSFLSGGIDSSIVSAIMAKVSAQPISTFSIGFKEKDYDESERSQLVAKHIGSNHTQYMLGVDELLEYMDDIIAYFDEPFGDSSAIPSYMVAKKAREKVTVVLTGDCADELFAGYEKYLGNYYVNKYNSLSRFLQQSITSLVQIIPHTKITNQLLRKVKKVLASASLSHQDRYAQLTSLGFSDNQKRALMLSDNQLDVSDFVKQYYNELNADDMNKTFYSDVKLVLEGDMLPKVDRMCMINSLEARVPFLDSKIVDFSFKLPTTFKIEGKVKKKILKDTFRDLLPTKTLTYSKKGFGLPLRTWFKHELKEELLNLLNVEQLKAQQIFNSDYVQQLVQEHLTNKENHSAKLWLLFVFQKWYLNQFK